MVKTRLRSHAEAAGIDWHHRWHEREYSWMGSAPGVERIRLTGRHRRTQESSAHYFQRPDRSVKGDGLFDTRYDPTATSLRGYGMFTRVSKDAGTLRWEAMANVRSPGFEVNDLAYLDRADYTWFNGNIGGSWTTPTRWYRSIFTTFGGATEYNYDGDRTRAALQTFFRIELPNYWRIRAMGIHDVPAFDDRLTRGGPVVKRAGYDVANVQVSTDARSSAVFDVAVQSSTASATTPGPSRSPLASPSSRPPTSSSNSRPATTGNQNSEQYVTSVEDPTATAFYGKRYVFGYIETTTLSLTTRVNWTFTPNLTLQLYAQPFIASGDYSSFREFAAPRTSKRACTARTWAPSATTRKRRTTRWIPTATGQQSRSRFRNPDFTTSALRGTAVLALGVPSRIHAVLRLDPGASRLRPRRRLRLRAGPQGHLRPAAHERVPDQGDVLVRAVGATGGL